MAGDRPAKVFQCPSCSGQITIRATGQTTVVACQSCGSIIDATDENHKILSKGFQRKTLKPTIPLGKRGKLRGVVWECIGFMERSDSSGQYRWREYLLFSPGRPFRWLTEFDGHWNYVSMTKEKPKKDNVFKDSAECFGKQYRKFHVGTAIVRYVEGEFYWRISVGETVRVEDYVAPPEILSMEQSKDEIVWAIGIYLQPDEIKKAFQLENAYFPPVHGVAPNQPSTISELAPELGKLWGLFLTVLVVIQILHTSLARNSEAFNGQFTYKPMGAMIATPSFELKNGTTNIALDLYAPIQNSWLEVNGELVNDHTGDTYEFENGVEYYFGRDSDGGWSEGGQTNDKVLSSIPEGTYHLNVEATGQGTEQNYHLRVRRDVVTWKNFWWAFFLISLYPAFIWWRSRSFELSRWSTSDFSPYWEHNQE